MCGITGIIGPNDIVGNPEIIQKMTSAVAHRGPDAEGIWRNEGVALGHRRLSIIDLSEEGNQPMTDSTGRYVLIFNGEIYNYRELKAELPDYPYKSRTDSEVLLAAYLRWGVKCLDRLNGMFAFAIWDHEKKELFAARDRLGIKPLYLYHKNNLLAFASEVRALLASGLVPRQLDNNSLIDYLRYQTVHAPHTIVKDIQLLPAGHYLTMKGQKVEQHPYWSPGYRQNMAPTTSKAEWKRKIYSAFRKAVQRRLVSDVPFGAFLSGGVDSSAVVAMMSQVHSGSVNTFSVTFEEEAFSEAPYARMVADKFKTNHHEIQLSSEHFLALIPEALKAMDHPSGDGPNTFVVSQATKEAGIKMALSGLGGDEIFAGYPIFKQSVRLARLKTLNALPQPIRQFGGLLLQSIHPSIATRKIAAVLKKQKVSPIEAYPLARQVLLDNQIQALTTNPVLPPNRVTSYLQEHIHLPAPLLSQVSIAETGTYMQHVLLRDTDQMSMSHALEVRVPFLDHELVELVLQIPDEVKYSQTPKELLIASLGDLLPPEIFNRPKMGFVLPYQEWMKGDLLSLCEKNIRHLAERPYFNAPNLYKLWNDFRTGRPTVSWSRIWMLVVLEHWLYQHQIQ